VRLRHSVNLVRQFTAEGTEVEIYVPGSRLMDDGVADKISFSAAGCAFLRAIGMPHRTALHDGDLNDRYKGRRATQPGVCCSADECYVAACYSRSSPSPSPRGRRRGFRITGVNSGARWRAVRNCRPPPTSTRSTPLPRP